MNFEQLRYFSITAKYLNFTKASEHLFMSQPTLSRQISLLEEELGLKLFFRNNRTVYLTSAGEVFLKECDAMLSRHNKLMKRMHQLAAGVHGNLTITSLNIYYPELNNIYKEFCDLYPNISLTFNHQHSGQIIETIDMGKGDMGICFSFEIPDNIPHLEVLPFFRENFCVIMSESHPFANKKSLSIQDLKKERLYFLGDNSLKFIRDLWEQAKLSSAARVDLFHSDSIESVLLNVKASHGAAIIPLPVARENISGCKIAKIRNLDSYFEVVLIWKRNNENPALSLFNDHFKQHFSDGPKKNN
jgi:DNA-binding transcriptional LysR family regulator